MAASAKSLQNIDQTSILNLGACEVNSAPPRLRSPTPALVKVPVTANPPATAPSEGRQIGCVGAPGLSFCAQVATSM